MTAASVVEIKKELKHRDPEELLQLCLRLARFKNCLLYTSPSPRDRTRSRMPSSA